jgi:hypothetical protein
LLSRLFTATGFLAGAVFLLEAAAFLTGNGFFLATAGFLDEAGFFLAGAFLEQVFWPWWLVGRNCFNFREASNTPGHLSRFLLVLCRINCREGIGTMETLSGILTLDWLNAPKPARLLQGGERKVDRKPWLRINLKPPVGRMNSFRVIL